MNSGRLAQHATEIVVAFALLSRLPLPRLPDTAFERGARAVWAYPIVGACLAAIAVALGLVAVAAGLPEVIAAGIALSALVICSGAMHEDGLADVVDGFWGGHTAERRLEIMKDSRIGTYGTLALCLSCGLRWGAMASLLATSPAAIVAVAALSRSMMPALMAALPNARDTGLSRKVGRPSAAQASMSVLLASVFGVLLLGATALWLVAAALACSAIMFALSRRRIGGQTGDVLGATQQLCEIVLLCCLTVT